MSCAWTGVASRMAAKPRLGPKGKLGIGNLHIRRTGHGHSASNHNCDRSGLQ
jgi:hypothetical protein